MAQATAVLRSEWFKIKSVRSTAWTLALAFLVTVLLGALLSALTVSGWDKLTQAQQQSFDATSTSFSGALLGQLAVIAFGVLVVSGEYTSGMIRTSLAAVPQRGTLYFSKLAVATVAVFIVAEITGFASFFIGQAALGSHHTTLGAPNVLRATVCAGLYMTLLALFSMGVATMLRSSVLSLAVLVTFFLLVTNILIAVPGAKTVARYFPDQAGRAMTRVVQDAGTPFGPLGGFGIMLLWVAAVVLGGYALLQTRDA
ncbi:ABC-type transport system involved in multi-copper enzyme maturation permease subunit [Streptomyces sp. 846.5]|nr:ABC transporter permease [Streptomyces sp. 846.5]TDT97705.1 ABC-type transport system involved in multi-copper enzyme maturation permease subunit [Streptomyces sp. 846.5]